MHVLGEVWVGALRKPEEVVRIATEECRQPFDEIWAGRVLFASLDAAEVGGRNPESVRGSAQAHFLRLPHLPNRLTECPHKFRL